MIKYSHLEQDLDKSIGECCAEESPDLQQMVIISGRRRDRVIRCGDSVTRSILETCIQRDES